MNVSCENCKVDTERIEKLQPGTGTTITVHQCPGCAARFKITRHGTREEDHSADRASDA